MRQLGTLVNQFAIVAKSTRHTHMTGILFHLTVNQKRYTVYCGILLSGKIVFIVHYSLRATCVW